MQYGDHSITILTPPVLVLKRISDSYVNIPVTGAQNQQDIFIANIKQHLHS